jgi:hypothetical protein
MPRARDNVLTVPSVGRRRPVSRSRSVLGSMSAAWVNCARVQPRRIRSRSTTSERTCQPRAPTNRGPRLTAEPARRWTREAGSLSVAEDARSFIPLVTVEGRADRTHRRNAVTGADPSGRWKPTHTCLVPLCVWGSGANQERGSGPTTFRAAAATMAPLRGGTAERGAGGVPGGPPGGTWSGPEAVTCRAGACLMSPAVSPPGRGRLGRRQSMRPSALWLPPSSLLGRA